MKYTPRKYQGYATQRIINDKVVGLFMEMSLGKTVATLTAIDSLIYDSLEVDKVLVIAPKRVAENTWPDEIKQWDHLRHLRIAVAIGSERKRKEALASRADVYVINRENTQWLVAQYQQAWPFKMVVIDESSSFKAHDSKRFKAMKMVRPFIDRIVLLTGTPAPNGLMDLWSQIYLMDMGKRLGKFITHYRDRFFYKPSEFKYEAKEEAADTIHDLISDICISMKTEDYLELPDVLYSTVHITLEHDEQERYNHFERERVLEVDDADNITAVNAAALSGKLRQLASGAIYDENKQWVDIHTAKLDMLQEKVEELNGNPVIVAYQFRHELERIKKRLKDYKPRMLEKPEDLRDWNDGKIKVLLAHPASIGHGMNLQYGGHNLIWYSIDWGLELYRQMNARLPRPGQKHVVNIVHLVVKSTIDERILPALENKAKTEDALMEAVKAIINKHL